MFGSLIISDLFRFQICTLRPLKEIFALVRDLKNIQLFMVEYKNGLIRSYLTNDR